MKNISEKINLKKGLVLLLLMTVSQTFYGQEMPKIIPPSPETATILQHSPVNVSLYTGTPNISVPFYTITHAGVEIPISLSYSSDGIRVENIASWAGLGWSLNAGGLISRTINKLPDDYSSLGYMNTTYTIADLLSRDPMLGPPSAIGVWSNFGGPEDQPWQLDPVRGDGNKRDYEPDIFSFSFLGYSGQFYYNQAEGEFNQAPLSNLRIEAIKTQGGSITGFIITDEAGIQYYFGSSKDQTRTAREVLKDARTKSITLNGVYESNPPFSMETFSCFQSWMLLDIVFPTSQELIEFNYFLEENVETYVLTEEELLKTVNAGCLDYTISYMMKVFNQPKLENIIFPEGKIVFEKESTPRMDLKNSYALKNIILYDKSEQIIKKTHLNTSYWQSTIGNNTNLLFDLNEIERGRHRLRLDSLSIQDRFSQTDGQYTFEYNSQNLPNRYSRSIDYFGYYNGKNNISLIPRIYQYGTLVGSYIGNANRSVDPAFTDASVLERITYPTGGYDEFVWENNVISSFTGDASTYRDNLVDDEVYLTSDLALFGDPDPAIDFSVEFTVPEGIVGTIDFTVTMSGCNPPNFNQTACDFILKIVNVGQTDPYLLYIYEASFSLDAYDLPPGNYKIIAISKEPYVAPNQQNNSTQVFSVYGKWNVDNTPGEWIYDGLRIQEIKTFDREESQTFSKSYDYRYFENNSLLSSGTAINIVDVLNSTYFVDCPSAEGAHNSALKFSSRSQASTIATKGSLVGYKNVTEKFNNGLLGYNQYTYSVIGEYPPHSQYGSVDYYTNNLIPANFRNQMFCDWLRGNVLKTETFDQQHLRLSTKIYEYETANTKWIQYSGLQILFFPAGGMGVCWNSSVTEHHRLKKVTESNFYQANEVTLTKEYFYNHLSQVAEERIYDNNLLNSTSKYFYPSDQSMATKPYVPELIAQNRIGAPLVTQKFDFNSKVAEQETVYKDWQSGLIAPETIKTSKGDADSEHRIRYVKLDDFTGNPLQVQQENGTPITYIWGYNRTRPVAKIENMAYNSIPTGLITAIHDATDESAMFTALTALRNHSALSSAMVTTYTYIPLVGIKTMTDPKGYTMTYHYDSFNRLEKVTDMEGNILSENQYHYRTQN